MHPQTRPHVPSPASPMWAPLGSPAPSDELQATGGGRWASGWCAWAGGLACAGDKITRNRVCGTPGSALPFPHSDQIQARSRLDRCYRLHLSNEDTWAWVCPSRVAEAQAGRPGLTPKSPSPRAAASGVPLHAGPASKCSGLVSGSSVFAEASRAPQQCRCCTGNWHHEGRCLLRRTAAAGPEKYARQALDLK